MRVLLLVVLFALSVCEASDYVAGHSVLVGRCAEESTEWKFALMKEAKQSIELATGFSGGEMFKKIVRVLRDRLLAEPQLRVHLAVARGFCLLPFSAEGILESVKRQFPDRFHYQVTSMSLAFANGHWQTREHHVKLLVVDEKYFVVGGTNMYDTYCTSDVLDQNVFYFDPVQQLVPRACYDMDVCCRGPLAKNMRELFFELWERYRSPRVPEEGYFPVAEKPIASAKEVDQDARWVGDVAMRMASSGPGMRFGACTECHVNAIYKAERSIDLMHMYTHPHRTLRQALEGAVERGVDLRVVTNGNSQAGFSPVPRVFGFFNRSTFFPLLTANQSAEIYECTSDNTLYHRKVMVVDGRYSLIGSYNFGKKSHYGDYEVVIEIDSPAIAAEFVKVMEADMGNAKRCKYPEARLWAQSWWYQAMNALQRWFVVGPLL